jgi:hypothetical protein
VQAQGGQFPEDNLQLAVLVEFTDGGQLAPVGVQAVLDEFPAAGGDDVVGL